MVDASQNTEDSMEDLRQGMEAFKIAYANQYRISVAWIIMICNNLLMSEYTIQYHTF